jgi:prefoldin beta subunit
MAGEELQQLLMQAQALQQQLQGIMAQKEAMNVQMLELSKAMKELDGLAKGEEVYKIAGPVLIKEKGAKAKKDLEEKKELISMRVKSLEKTETQLKDDMNDLRDKLTKAGG